MKLTQHALVYIRNFTYDENCDPGLINELAEAVHEIPNMLLNWNDTRMEELILHLKGIDRKKYPNAPNLEQRFRDILNSIED